MLALLRYIYRLATDRQVRCVRCTSVVGYVVRAGHRSWLCGDCSASGEVVAVVEGA